MQVHRLPPRPMMLGHYGASVRRRRYCLSPTQGIVQEGSFTAKRTELLWYRDA